MEIDEHFIKENIDNVAICMPFVSTQQIVDIFIRTSFELFISKLDEIDI